MQYRIRHSHHCLSLKEAVQVFAASAHGIQLAWHGGCVTRLSTIMQQNVHVNEAILQMRRRGMSHQDINDSCVLLLRITQSLDGGLWKMHVQQVASGGLGETQSRSILIAYGNSNLNRQPLMMSYKNEAANLCTGFLCYLSDLQEERNVCVNVVNGDTEFGHDLISNDMPERCFNSSLMRSLWTTGNDPPQIFPDMLPRWPTGFEQMLIREVVGHHIGQNDVNVFGDLNDNDDDRTDSESSIADSLPSLEY